MERAITLATGCGGDGATIVTRLRDGALLRFRADAIDRLEEYFRESGHIVEEAPHPPLLVQAAVRSAFLDGGFTSEEADAAMAVLHERIDALST
jgi:hypothetical protein